MRHPIFSYWHRLSQGTSAGVPGSGGGLSLPLFRDFSILPDGALPSGWTGPTYSVVSGKVVNTPTLGPNLINDLAKATTGGANSLVLVGNQLTATYVNSDTAISEAFTDAGVLSRNLVAGEHLIYSADISINIGAARILLVSQNNYIINSLSGAIPVPRYVSLLFVTAATMIYDQLGAGEALTVDNQSLNSVVTNTLFAGPNVSATGNVHLRAQYATMPAVNAGSVYQFGLVSRLDDKDNPQNYVLLVINRNANNQICLYKVVAGGPTRLYAAALGTTLIDETYIELRWSGNDCAVYHDNTLLTTVTVNDVSATNELHDVYALGTSNLISYALSVDPTDITVGYIGGSITWMDAGTSPGYRRKTTAWMRNTHLSYEIAEIRNDVNGQIAWEELARLRQGLWTVTPSEILIDFAANHLANDDFENSTIEALVRYLRATYPSARLLLPIFGVWTNIASVTTTGSSTTRRAALVALAQHYDLDYVDVGAAMESAIAGGATLADWYAPADLTHPNASGHAYISTLLRPYLGLSYILSGSSQWTGNLLDYARINANSDNYDDAYLLTNGVDNAGETGAGWSTTLATARTSAAAGDTISFTGTFRSFGLLHTNTGQIQWSIDGGAYSGTINLAAQKATFLITSGLAYVPHTVTFKVISGAPVFRQFDAI